MITHAPEVPDWFEIAYRELASGVVETPGPQATQRIVQYHAKTSGRFRDDEVPWCSSFVNWCMAQAGIDRTNHAAARSWLWWGEALDVPVFGCVVVLKRGQANHGPGTRWPDATGSGWTYPSGHVGLFVGLGASTTGAGVIDVLGGNQGDRVSVRSYSVERVLGYRWPKASQGREPRTQET